jgi:hypothetical protein
MDWTNAPILADPSETRRIGGRLYSLYYDGQRLRRIAWRTPHAVNTLLESLSEPQMIAIAQGTRPLR